MDIKFNEKLRTLTLARKTSETTAHVFICTPEETAQLVRFCADLAASDKPLEAVGVQVITAALAYSDFDEEQDTKAYNWAVAVTNRELADALIEEIRCEVQRAGFDPDEVSILPVPEIRFDVKRMDVLTTAEAVRTDLRIALCMHESDSVFSYAQYWEDLNFSSEQANEIEAVIADYRWDQKSGEFAADEFLAYCHKHAGDRNLIIGLERWIKGESLKQIEKANAIMHIRTNAKP